MFMSQAWSNSGEGMLSIPIVWLCAFCAWPAVPLCYYVYLLKKSTTDEIGNLGKAIVVHVCVPDQKTNYSTISFGKQMGRWQMISNMKRSYEYVTHKKQSRIVYRWEWEVYSVTPVCEAHKTLINPFKKNVVSLFL